MIKKLLPLLLFLFLTESVSACCAAQQKRIFPLGIKDNKVVALEIYLYRNCDEGFYSGNFNDFSFVWWGSIRLMQQENDSLVELESIDTLFRFTECNCGIKTRDSLSRYDSIVKTLYTKGLTEAKKLQDFESMKLTSIRELTDADSLLIYWSKEDTLYYHKTRHNYPFYRDKRGYEPVYNITQLRTYRYKKKEVYVVMVDNNYYIPDEENLKDIKVKPKIKIEKDGYFSSYPEWHGHQEDFILLK